MLGLHLLLTLLPGAALAAYALKRGEREEPILLSIALAASGVAAMMAFWAYYADPLIGTVYAYLLPIASACLLLWSLFRQPTEAPLLRRLGRPVVLWALGCTFLVFFGFLHGGTERPLATGASRFVYLPSDNGLPFFFAEWFFEHGHHGVPPIFPGVWLASDRPPLQMGFVLAERALNWQGGELEYQVLGVILQQLWIVALWALLLATRVGRTTRALTMLVVLASDLTLVHGFFVWPKMLAAAFLLAAAALVATPLWSRVRQSAGGAALVATLIALGVMSHAATVFGVAGLVMLGAAKGVPGRRWVAVAVMTGACLTIPWSAYQRFGDPPGNRLTKWMLGGVVGPDDRGAVETLTQAYGEAGWRGTLHNKVANFVTLTGGDVVLNDIPNAIRSVRRHDINDALARLKGMFFMFLAPACGVLLFAPAAMALARPRGYRQTAEWRFALTSFALAALGCVSWCLLIFGTGDAIPILLTGSLAVPILAFAGAVAGLRCTFPRLAIVLVGARVVTTLLLYTPPLPQPGFDAYYSTVASILASASLLGFAMVAFGRRSPLVVERML